MKSHILKHAYGIPGFDEKNTQKQMLGDRLRLKQFKNALEQRVKPGDTVIDLGAGWGVLSIYAAQAGAKKVYAIEAHPKNIRKAKELVAKRKLSAKIEFIEGFSLDLNDSALPKVDLIVSETLNHSGLSEGIAHYLYDASGKWLKKGGRLMPIEVSVITARANIPPIELGIGISNCFPLHAKPEWLLEDPKTVETRTMGSPCHWAEVFGHTLTVDELRGHLVWFRAKLSDTVFIENKPGSKYTSWGQIYNKTTDEIFQDLRGGMSFNGIQI
ncbi:50S ribosomal protein L11 methyltransferase [Candidatus Micrarchaeota archaeon]|nr:50S ribosomal protein L11 methyltransferase [Candidatus Micrarchaeota archaeon]